MVKAVEKLNDNSERTYSYEYDTLGRLTSVTDPTAGVTKVSYDVVGNISSMTDANGGVTIYSYDNVGRLLKEISPIGSVYQYTYDAERLLKQQENARGQKTSYTYDKIGRVTSVTDELGTIEYTYDRNSNVLTVSDGQDTIKRKYDALNRVIEYTDYQGNTIKYAYDELGNLISLTYPGGEIVRYTYYKNGLLNTVTDHKGRTTTYEYDANENLTVTIRPNGTKEIRTYNVAGQMISQRDVKVAEDGEDEGILEYTYTYDAAGNVASITGKETTDTKEGLSNLNAAVMTYDEGNRLLTYNGEELRYDADGNMTYGPVDGQMSELSFDCRNRLVKAGDVTYAYDPENNRISAETKDYIETYVTDTTSSSMSRVLSSTKVYKSSNAKDTTLYIYGNGLISEHLGDIHLYHHYDNLGSTTKLTNLKGEVVETYTYGTYGELLSGNKTLTRFLYNGRFGISTDDNGLE